MTAEKPTLIATFQPQADMPGNRIQDIDGAVQVDITKWFLAQPLETVKSIAAQAAKIHGKDLDMIAEASDVLLVRHQGPYRVELDIEDIEAFLAKSDMTFEGLDESTLKDLRSKFNVLGYEIPHPVGEDMFNGPLPSVKEGPTLEFQITDWRIEDGGDSEGELSEMQRKPWKVVCGKGGWGATMDFVAPDGSRRSLSIEIDKGMPVVRTYSGDEVDAVVRMGREGTHVSSGQNSVGRSLKAVFLDGDGIREAEEDFPEEFADISTGPAPR